MDKVPIFTWRGAYVGFLYEDCLFDRDGAYLGWMDGRKHVWRADGSYLGDLKHEHYILRHSGHEEPAPRWPKRAPLRPVPPAPKQRRPPKAPLRGWVDALEDEPACAE